MPILIAAALMGIIEGITEFLPVSSTGHLIVFGPWLGFGEKSMSSGRADAFEIFIQLGAILAVVIYFRKRLWNAIHEAKSKTPAGQRSRRFLIGICVATFPAIVVGLIGSKIGLFDKLPSPTFVAAVLIGGGVLLWAVD